MSSITVVPSSISSNLRLRELARRTYALGPRAVYEAMCLAVASGDVMNALETLGAYSLHRNPAEAYGSGDLPPTIYRVK